MRYLLLFIVSMCACNAGLKEVEKRYEGKIKAARVWYIAELKKERHYCIRAGKSTVEIDKKIKSIEAIVNIFSGTYEVTYQTGKRVYVFEGGNVTWKKSGEKMKFVKKGNVIHFEFENKTTETWEKIGGSWQVMHANGKKMIRGRAKKVK